MTARSDFNLDIWAHVSDGPVFDPRPSEEILGDILQRVSGAYDRFTLIGREMGFEASGGLGSPDAGGAVVSNEPSDVRD